MNYIGTWTLFKRETNRFLKVYLQTILSPVVSNLLFLTVFGLSLNRANTTVMGVPYLQFLIPGLIAMGLSNNAFQNPASSIMISKYQGLIGNLMTIPLKRGSMLAAFIASAVIRGFIVGTVTWLTSLLFVQMPYTSIPVIFIASLLFAMLFGFLGFIIGVWAKEFDNVAFVQNFVLMPLTFLGGVFYPITSLPPLFQTISSFNPIVYMIDPLRYGFVGVSTFPVITSLLITSVMVVVTGVISYWIIKTGWRLQS